ncbi:hypothetical protein SAMN05216246_105104 [Actinomyces denticolens]|uniref:Uncharacterized protein n=1 Tax=Actinomyces denticolens TaxID=52767 RepID=A0ABY1I9P9_9ACTO|nr:hypothetical protein SAMN05216246_105104 [Actinomyces denticolens]
MTDAIVIAVLDQGGYMGDTGWVRSGAWIWDFPSTRSTIALAGEDR